MHIENHLSVFIAIALTINSAGDRAIVIVCIFVCKKVFNVFIGLHKSGKNSLNLVQYSMLHFVIAVELLISVTVRTVTDNRIDEQKPPN